MKGRLGSKNIIYGTVLYFIFLLPQVGFSQDPNDKINPNNFNSELLSQLITNKINGTRDSLGIQTLTEAEPLNKAAEHHAEYLKNTGKLSHKEKNRKYSSPAKRVKQFGGEFKAVAENVAFVSAGPTKITGNKKEFTYNTYNEVAKTFVRNWIKSPGHYKNISDPEMNKTGVAVSYDPKKNLVYAVQVFSETEVAKERPLTRMFNSDK